MRFICLFLLLSSSQLLAQLADPIHICNDSICQIIDQSNTKIRVIHLPRKGASLEKYYHKNRKNFRNHRIYRESFDSLFSEIKTSTNFEKKPRYQRREIMRSLIREHSYAFSEVNRLMDFMNAKDGFCDKDAFRYSLEKLDNYRASSFLLNGFDSYLYFDVLKNHNKRMNFLNSPYIVGLINNRKLITEHIDFLIKKDYFNYNQSTSAARFVKGSTVFHDNDVFMPFFNEDKYYTGGGRVELYTDFLRINYIQNFFNRNHKYLSYQGVFFEVKAFTPFIRYKSKEVDPINGITKEERLQRYSEDRPFASYEYLGFANYKLHHKGHKRVRTQYRFGQIGNERSERIQGIIHRDQVVKSIKVIGWENQIANGGRYGLNFDYRRDWMLISPDHDIFDRNKANADKEARKNRRKHIHGTIEVNVGNFLTAAEIGLGISNLNFKERDNSNNFRLRPGYNTSWLLYANIGMRYVQHNTSLEGFGVVRTPDDDKTEEDLPSNNHVIAKENVVRIVGLAEMGVGFRVRRATLFYKLILHTQEFKNPPSEFIYGWGTIGMSFSNLSFFGETD